MNGAKVIFWDATPRNREASVLATVEGDFPGEVVQGLAEASTKCAFDALADRLGDARNEKYVLEARARDEETLHFVFDRDAVQVSYGECGFVPLKRLLDYSEAELASYLSQTQRIALTACIAASPSSYAVN